MATSTTHYLFDLALQCMNELGTLRSGTATGGSTNTIVDANGLKLIDDQYYDEGTAFITYDAGGSSAAPEKEFSIVASHSKGSTQLEVQDQFSAAVVAGDGYSVANRRFTLNTIIDRINMRLFADIYIPQTDTSLTTVSEQLAYTLPTPAALDLRQVFVAQSTVSAQENWKKVLNWQIKPADTGGTHQLVLESPITAGYSLLLLYGGRHPRLRVASDQLSEFVHPHIVVYGACADAMQAYKDKTRLQHLDQKIDDLRLKAEEARSNYPLPRIPSRDSHLVTFSRGARFDPDNVSLGRFR